jgi:hypothetical protein
MFQRQISVWRVLLRNQQKQKQKQNQQKQKQRKIQQNNQRNQQQKNPEPRIDPLHQVSKEEAKKSKSVKKAPQEESEQAKKQPTHKMPDGSIHTGKKHTKDSKVVKPAKAKDSKAEKPAPKERKKYERSKTAPPLTPEDIKALSKPAPKERKKYERSKTAPPLTPEDIKALSNPKESKESKNTPQYQKLLDRAKARKDKAKSVSKKPLSEYNKFVKDYSAKNKNLGKDLMKQASIAWKAQKKEGVVRVKTAPKKKSGRTGIQKVEQTDEQLMQRVINTVAELEGSDELTDEQLEEKILLIVAEKQLENMKPKDRKKYERSKTKPPLTKKDIKALSKPKKECPPGKVLNPKTNRCKKDKKKRKTKGTSPWHAFLAKFRAENPQIKGKEVMKEASKQYKLYGDIVPHFVDSDSEDEDRLGLDDDDLDEDAVELDVSLELDNRLVKVPDKTTNQILADVLDSFDAMVKTLQNVANSDTRKSEKEKEFNIIADRAFEFYEKLPFVQLDPLSKKRVDDAFSHIRDTITTGYKDLKSGIDVVEYREYEDDDTVEAIIDNELLIPASVLDQYVAIREEANRRQEEAREPIVTDTVNLNSKDNLPVELQVNFEDEDGFRACEPFCDDDDDDDIYDLGYDENYGEIQDFSENIKQNLLEEERKQQLIKLRVEDIYMEELEKLDKERATNEALKRIRERKQLYARNAELYGDEREFTERDLDNIIREVEEDFIDDYDLDFLPDDPDEEGVYVTEDFLPDDPDDTDEEGVYITDDTMLAMIDEEQEADLQYSRKPSNYPNNVLTDENSIQPTSIENSNMSAPRLAPPPLRNRIRKPVRITELTPKLFDRKDGKRFIVTGPKSQQRQITTNIPTKEKRKRPLNLRLYQEFLKLMRKNDPSLSRNDITQLWKSNKDAYIDMLMEIVDLSGGNLLNDEHYFNALRNIGGVMLGGSCCDMCEGGELGNKYYQMKHQDTGFDRTSYDKVNNPYGIGKTHADEQPRLPQVTASSTTTPTYSGSDIDMTDLSDPRAWGKTFENIASGVYDGLKTVYKILSPLSWIF